MKPDQLLFKAAIGLSFGGILAGLWGALTGAVLSVSFMHLD